MRRWLFLLLLLVLAVLLAAHVVYRYLPGERPAMPDPDGLPARMLASGAFETCFWVPYPHQNVGALARAIEDWPGWLAAVARTADLPPPDLPSFGPFAVPPAREVAVCSDGDGGRLQIAAEIYPTVALLAKLAGRVADNPWLAGGTVERGGRRARVAWRGRLWTVQVGDPVELGWTRRVPRQRALAIVRLERAYSYLPPGTFVLARRGDGLELALADGEEPASLSLARGAPVLLALAGADGDKPPAALALFDTGSVEGFRLPSAAVFHPPGAERWSLPGGKISEVLGAGVPRGNAAGWEIVASDAESLRQAGALAPRLAAIVPPAPPSPVAPGKTVRLALSLAPAPTLELAGRIVDFLDKVPLVERRQVRRWRDWRAVLAPLAGCERVTLASEAGPPDGFRLRVEGCRVPAGPTPPAGTERAGPRP